MPVPPTDPTDPFYWPEAPPQAGYHSANNPVGGGPYWTVQAAPPDPWPYADTFTRAQVGPIGTEWHFSWGDIGQRLTDGASHLAVDLVQRWLRVAKIPFPLVEFVGETIWTNLTPETPVTSVELFRATVHSTLGGGEEAANVLHFVDLGAPANTRDVAGCLAVGAKVVTAWEAFLAATVPTLGTVGAFYASAARFDEVRVAAISVTSPAPVVAGKPHPINYDVPTQFVAFPAGANTSGGAALPYEVACVMSLGTGQRGKSHRGRTYLGPMDLGVMDSTTPTSQGTFIPAVVNAVGAAFWTHIVAGLAATPQLQLVVASIKNATVLPVTAVRVGAVPDSQRRRRRSQDEAYHLSGGVG